MVDTAAGPVRARATCRAGKCVSVEFANVPSLVDPADPWPSGYVLADPWGVTGTTAQ